MRPGTLFICKRRAGPRIGAPGLGASPGRVNLPQTSFFTQVHDAWMQPRCLKFYNPHQAQCDSCPLPAEPQSDWLFCSSLLSSTFQFSSASYVIAPSASTPKSSLSSSTLALSPMSSGCKKSGEPTLTTMGHAPSTIASTQSPNDLFLWWTNKHPGGGEHSLFPIGIFKTYAFFGGHPTQVAATIRVHDNRMWVLILLLRSLPILERIEMKDKSMRFS
jgi:hypothetical protein